MKARTAKTFSVAYRKGGTAQFSWNRVLEVYATREAANASAQDLGKMGYKSIVYKTADLDSIGLPDTWE